MTNTPKLVMPYLVAGQAQKEITHNDALNDLDSLAQISVINKTTATPPISPSEGDSYLIATSPTGVWAGNANAIASYYSGWRIKAPKTGWFAYVQNEGVFYLYDGSAWNVYKEIPPLGSASAPSYSFIGDSNTGIYSPGADQIALTTGGLQRLAVDASGNTSLSGALNVTGSINGNLTGNVTGNVSGNAATVTTNANLSGDVSSVGNTTTIGAAKVTNAMLAGSITASNLVGSDIATLGTVTIGSWNAGAVTSSGAVTATALVPNGSSMPANGMYLPAANTPAICANSTDVVRFLQLSSAVNYFTFRNSATGSNAYLSVDGSDSNITMRINGKGSGAVTFQSAGGSWIFSQFSSTAATGATLNLQRSRGTTQEVYTIVQSGDTLGSVAFRGANGGAGTYNNAASIEAEVDGTPGSTNDMPGRILLKTTPDGSGTLAERMRIDNAGNVVVNTAALATNATNGFLYIPSCAGAPTGTPTSYSGRVPMVYDSTNNKLYIYNTAWKSVTLA